jgi:TrmH family RNA methyltransferase
MTRFMKLIRSRQHETVARYRTAARGGDPSVILLDGEHLVAEAASAPVVIRHVLVAADAVESGRLSTLLDRLADRGAEIDAAAAPVMAAASPVRSPSPIVALADRPAPGPVFAKRPPFVIIACDMQDPGNLGAIVRVAEAAGASGVIAAGQSADPFGWKALRGSMGSALRLPIVTTPGVSDAIARARREGCRVLATVPRHGVRLFEAMLKGAVAVLVGGEGHGLDAATVAAADERVTVPMEAPVESLNAAVTAALVAYEARRQRT